MKSSEWKNNRLIVYLNHISVWPWRLSLDVKPEQRESVNQLLAQHLLTKQRQSTTPDQISA
jgi:hypothetical protein